MKLNEASFVDGLSTNLQSALGSYSGSQMVTTAFFSTSLIGVLSFSLLTVTVTTAVLENEITFTGLFKSESTETKKSKLWFRQ